MSTSSVSDSREGSEKTAAGARLGFGVRVQWQGDEIRILSRKLPLGWRSSGPGIAGTAVHFEGRLWEAHLLDEGEQGELWQLLPWPEGEVLRHSEELSARFLAELSRKQTAQKRHEEVGYALLVLMPLVGILPAVLQEQIEVEWGLRAWKSTLLSALPGLFGALLAVGVVLGDWKPPVPGPVAIFLCFYFFFEGMFRMNYSFTLHRPMGSILTWPLGRVLRRRTRSWKSGKSRKGPGVLGAILRFILLGFAPNSMQERLVEPLELPPRLLSVMTATAELIGGLFNLLAGGADDPFVLLSLLFLFEGVGRLLFVWMKGRPAGSILGLPLLPLYRRWLRHSIPSAGIGEG